ncbi:MAG: hypothetical protein GAK31_00837 [Stenotrophomonas maltophilia]|uniref:Uncharacterized protein n=1 Tax=Stenotrophomonas maltophilia TaxID=40324 RepID=A0A7V8FK63_STEMA|nr:MAG: hypothetical protein GAK31_00837 [Stenotrophomonas maltophilia]
MSLRNILARFRLVGQDALDQAMTVEARPSSLAHKDFREFTAPPAPAARWQHPAGCPHNDRLGRIGIIPGMGGNIP